MELKIIEAFSFEELKEDIQNKVINDYFSNIYFNTKQHEDIFNFKEYNCLPCLFHDDHLFICGFMVENNEK